MSDWFEVSMRLCDDEGQVSDKEIDAPNEPKGDKTYLDRLNRFRRMGSEPRPDITTSFPCTGDAHLAGHHITCTSPAHFHFKSGVTYNVTCIAPRPGTADPKTCGHTFAYWSVVPPTHCYLCGAPLNNQRDPRPIWMVDQTPHHMWRPDLAPTYTTH